MNFVYDPVNAAQITNYVQYVSPVSGVREELQKMGGDAAALADNPLLFPDDADAGEHLRVRRPAAGARPADHRPLRHDHGG